MSYKGAITIAVLCAGVFAAYAGISLQLALELLGLVTVTAMVAVGIPDYEAELALAEQLAAGIAVAVDVELPSVSVDLGLALSARLSILLGLVVLVEALLGDASLQAYTYQGPGSALGGTLGAAVGSGWPDGTAPTEDVFAIVLAATSSGSTPVGSLAKVVLLGGGKGYARGLCSVTLPGGATATPTINPTTGTITAIAVAGMGSGYLAVPVVTISDQAAILGVTNTSPIVLTLANTLDVAAVTVAGVEGCTSANARWCAKVLSPSTIALYEDGAFTRPSSGNGAWAGGGTIQGTGSGAAAIASMGGGAMAQLQDFFPGLAFAPGLVEAGTVELSAACSATFGLLEQLLAELQLEAKICGSASAKIDVVPPSIAGNVSIVAKLIATLKAAISAFPPLPSIQASASAAVNGRAALVGQLVAGIGAQLGIATEELLVFTYRGPGSAFAANLSATIAGGWPDATPAGSNANVVILAATSGASEIALETFFPAAA